jgi:hypothetical protein
MREEADKFEGQVVTVRKEDKSLKPFVIPIQKMGIKGQTMITIHHVILPGEAIDDIASTNIAHLAIFLYVNSFFFRFWGRET